MKNINHTSLNIPKPVLKRQTAGIYIPRPVLKRQTNRIIESPDEKGLPIYYHFCDYCTLLSLTKCNNINIFNKQCDACIDGINMIDNIVLD